MLIPRDPDDDRGRHPRGQGGGRVATSRPCSPATCCGCTCATPRPAVGRRWWRTPRRATSAATRTCGSRCGPRAHRGRGRARGLRLKYEGGVHRVQRVPVTESQGRIHTSAAGVLVMPEAEEVEVTIDPHDLRIDVYRSSGPGGQSVNTTDSAVRITHVPSGLVVSCQNEKSQLQNKEAAMRVLRARLHQLAQDEANAEASAARRSQVRTVDRSERIRTYNFPENRISDHRTGFKAYNLDTVLGGELDPVVTSAIDADEAARLAALADGPVVDRAARPRCRHPGPAAAQLSRARHPIGRCRRARARCACAGGGARGGAPAQSAWRSHAPRVVCRPRRRTRQAGTAAAPHRPRLFSVPVPSGGPGSVRAAP